MICYVVAIKQYDKEKHIEIIPSQIYLVLIFISFTLYILLAFSTISCLLILFFLIHLYFCLLPLCCSLHSMSFYLVIFFILCIFFLFFFGITTLFHVIFLFPYKLYQSSSITIAFVILCFPSYFSDLLYFVSFNSFHDSIPSLSYHDYFGSLSYHKFITSLSLYFLTCPLFSKSFSNCFFFFISFFLFLSFSFIIFQRFSIFSSYSQQKFLFNYPNKLSCYHLISLAFSLNFFPVSISLSPPVSFPFFSSLETNCIKP